MTKIFNKTSELNKRRSLRRSMPDAEVIIWSRIKGRQIDDIKFRRQYSVGNFIIDFYCAELKLAIEIDGESHYRDGIEEYDIHRQQWIQQYGICFLRFQNSEVYQNLNGVLQTIYETATVIKQQKKHFPLLNKEGTKGR